MPISTEEQVKELMGWKGFMKLKSREAGGVELILIVKNPCSIHSLIVGLFKITCFVCLLFSLLNSSHNSY